MASRPAANSAFVNRAHDFANRAPRLARGLLMVVGGGMLATIAGPFGTGAIAWAPRAGFWFTMILLNFALWEAWFAALKRRGWHWRKILLLGLPVLLLPLPLEVDAGLRLFAGSEGADHLGIFWRGGAIAVVWALAMLLLAGRAAPTAAPGTRFPGTAIRLADIAALMAEDHYVRIHLGDGGTRLVHSRFRDALAVMAGIVGEQVNRGGWVADAHRHAARYRDRKWYIAAGNNLELPVSRGHAPRLREAGWLTRTG